MKWIIIMREKIKMAQNRNYLCRIQIMSYGVGRDAEEKGIVRNSL